LMNNLFLNFRKFKNISINKHKFDYSYIVQFDQFGEKVLKDFIKKENSNKKVLVGPLFTYEQLKNLIVYVNKYPYIKILVSNIDSFRSVLNISNLEVDLSKVISMPCGVMSEKNIYFGDQKSRKDKCLIYFKNNDQYKLETIKNFLNSKNIEYIVFENKLFKNSELIKLAKECKFSIVLTTTESQGFGVQELMSQNLPLLVWEESKNNYENKVIYGSSVPYWSSECGLKFNNLSELNNKFDYFILELNKYSPAKFFKRNLTYEKNYENLMNIFNQTVG